MLLTLIRMDKPYQSQMISLHQKLLMSTVFQRFQKIGSDLHQFLSDLGNCDARVEEISQKSLLRQLEIEVRC